MRLLFDTVAFLWALGAPERMSPEARSLITRKDILREISAVSVSEIAIKQARGKLDCSREDVAQGLAVLQMRVLPYTAEHAMGLFDLPLHHRDPFDRQIIAQALAEGIPVVTSDRAFSLYQNLNILW